MKVNVEEIEVNVEEILEFIELETKYLERESINSLLEEVKYAINSVFVGKYDSQEISKKFKIGDDEKLRIRISLSHKYPFNVDIYIIRTMNCSRSEKYKSFIYK